MKRRVPTAPFRRLNRQAKTRATVVREAITSGIITQPPALTSWSKVAWGELGEGAPSTACARSEAIGKTNEFITVSSLFKCTYPRSANEFHTPRTNWTQAAAQRNLSAMEGVFLGEKPDPNRKLRDVPHKPGVYLMKDRLKRVIYVGKARDLRKRLSQYFIPSRRLTADLKTRALLDSVWDFEIHLVRNEPEALLLEGKLIKEFRPKYNVSFRDDKRFLLVKVNLSDAIPRF